MERSFQVAKDEAGTRLDAWLQREVSEVSRSRWQALIKSGDVLLDGQRSKASARLRGGEQVFVSIPPAREIELKAEEIPLSILYEDEHLLVVDKAAGMVVHPAVGNWSGTLVHALLHHCRDLAGIGGELRPGIVHRLDKDTSGALVVAKTEPAMNALTAQFKRRETVKVYAALVWGLPAPARGTVETEIGRSAHDRKRMSVKSRRGRIATTHYRMLEVFKSSALMQIHIETGRTHQIRVHMAHIGHPVVGDKTYGGKVERRADCGAKRQMLHAQRLEFTHPATGDCMCIEAPLPEDMLAVIEGFRMELG